MENPPLLHFIDSSLNYLQELKKETPYILPNSTVTSDTQTSLRVTPIKSPLPKEEALPQPITAKASIKSESVLTPISPPKEPIQPLETSQKPTTCSEKKPIFSLQPPIHTNASSLQDLWTLLPKITPSLKLLEKIPSDAKAQKIKNRWKNPFQIPEIPLLSLNHPALNFLKDVSQAIDKHFFSSTVLDIALFEEKNTWDQFFQSPQLKVIVIPETML
ncbi:MAG: hypothetical protein EBZ47_07465, partial [Chlamydiae bacterium]|nr:hypothetical protein [Chlamydiota bacterium]